MYKIYNNEIKITQFLKGGSVFTSLRKSSSFNHHPLESKVYKYSTTGNWGYFLDFDEKLDYSKIRPLFGQEIIYDKFNQKMMIAIIFTLGTFFQYKDFLVEPITGSISLPEGGNSGSTDESKRIRKNLVTLGISVLKALGLFDHNANDFVEYDDFKKKVIGAGSGGTTGLLPSVFTNGTTPKNLAKIFEDQLVNSSTDFGSINYLSSSTDVNNIIDVIEEEISFLPTSIKPVSTIPFLAGYSLKNFYDKMKELKPKVLTDSECKKIYFKQIFRPPFNPLLVNQRYSGGGNYDQLQYMLNGGSLNSIVRIPNLSSYFKTQLKFIEHKLKINNKTLSEKSKADIMQIIDALDKHEENLKEQFELLKNAHLIDEDVIKIDEDAAKLKKAKNSLNKHIRYSGALGDIIRTILKEFKDEVTPKAAFENL